MREGRWIQEGDHYAVVLNEAFRNHFPNLDPGETIRLKINGTERNWIVVGFFQMAGKSSGYLAYTDYDSLSRETRLGGRSSTFRMLATDPYLSPEAQKSLCDRIEAHFRDRGYRVIDAAAGSSLTEATSDGLDVLTTFLLIMSLLTALVGCIGLAGTMSLNVMERTHEIGVMRAIGASDWMIRRLVLAEGLMTGMFSWVIGVLASFLVSRLLRDVIGYAVFDAPSPFAFTFTGVLIWLGAVLVLSVVASLIPAQKAVRLTIREVLAYE
jgi:putative ABC transport system permease protein